MKTQDLTGYALDWAVAQAQGITIDIGKRGQPLIDTYQDDPPFHVINEYNDNRWQLYAPSTDWAQGGPIIERERVRVEPFSGAWLACVWDSDCNEFHQFHRGDTALIAAMRCYVASKLGNDIDIPKETHD